MRGSTCPEVVRVYVILKSLENTTVGNGCSGSKRVTEGMRNEDTDVGTS